MTCADPARGGAAPSSRCPRDGCNQPEGNGSRTTPAASARPSAQPGRRGDWRDGGGCAPPTGPQDAAHSRVCGARKGGMHATVTSTTGGGVSAARLAGTRLSRSGCGDRRRQVRAVAAVLSGKRGLRGGRGGEGGTGARSPSGRLHPSSQPHPKRAHPRGTRGRRGPAAAASLPGGLRGGDYVDGPAGWRPSARTREGPPTVAAPRTGLHQPTVNAAFQLCPDIRR